MTDVKSGKRNELINTSLNVRSFSISKKSNNNSLCITKNLDIEYKNTTITLNVKNYFQNTKLVNNDTQNRNCRLTMEFYKLLNNLWKEPTKYKKYYTWLHAL